MKKVSIISFGLLAVCGLYLVSCGGSNETTQEENQTEENTQEEYTKIEVDADEFKATLSAYFELADAFVKTDDSLAKEKAKVLVAAITSTGDPYDIIKNHGKIISETELVEVQREHFKPLSESMYVLSRGNTEDLYLHHCSMAFDNEGANWISNDEEVLNPYFGDVMLHCGSSTKVE